MCQRHPPPTQQSIQINDVYVDENRMIYTVDRFNGGLYVMEMTV